MNYTLISGPYTSYEEADAKLQKHYGGDDGPYWVEEVEPNIWWIVVDTEYDSLTAIDWDNLAN